MSLDQNLNKILIIDFGSQFTQLIARRIRELGVFSEIVSHKKIKLKDIDKTIKGIILSGGPLNVYQINKYSFDKKIINLDIPILGKIAAGHPIEAISDNTNYFDIPQSLLGKGEYFLLEVEGDSMINAGIFDGDQVIIEKSNDAKNGEIVVALIDNNEATLKRIYKRGQQLALQPENPAFKTVIYGPDRVQIQGILKQLIRKY